MNTKFRNVGRVNFRPSAREWDPVKLTQKKITYLAGADQSNPEVTKKYKREAPTVIKRIKKLALQQHGQESARLFTKASELRWA